MQYFDAFFLWLCLELMNSSFTDHAANNWCASVGIDNGHAQLYMQAYVRVMTRHIVAFWGYSVYLIIWLPVTTFNNLPLMIRPITMQYLNAFSCGYVQRRLRIQYLPITLPTTGVRVLVRLHTRDKLNSTQADGLTTGITSVSTTVSRILRYTVVYLISHWKDYQHTDKFLNPQSMRNLIYLGTR